MAIPLVLTGPGGDYRTRYDVKGLSVIKQARSPMPSENAQGDTETAGSFATWSQFSRQQRRRPAPPRHRFSDADSFEHTPTTPPGAGGYPGAGAGTYDAHARLPADHAHAAALAWLVLQHQTLLAATTDLAAMQAIITQLTTPALGSTTPAPSRPRASTPDVVPPPSIQNPKSKIQNVIAQEPSHATQPDPQATPHPYPHPRPAHRAGLFPNSPGAGRRAWRQQSHRLRARRSPHPQGGLATRPQQGALFGD